MTDKNQESAPVEEVEVKPSRNGGGVTENMQPPKEIVLDIVDRLELENAQLLLMNADIRRQSLVHQLALSEREVMELRQRYSTKLNQLQRKYQFNAATHQMEPGTGRIVPLPQAGRPPIG